VGSFEILGSFVPEYEELVGLLDARLAEAAA
jgi:hypothetical protein